MRGETLPRARFCLRDIALRVTYTLSVTPEGRSNALVPLLGVLFRGRLPGELGSTFREWCVGPPLPESVCHSARCGVVVLDGECAVGPFQSRDWISSCVPGWELRTAEAPARPASCGRRPDHVDHARSHLRPLLRRPVSLPFLKKA